MNIYCKHCSQKYDVDEEMIGEVAECQGCGKDFIITYPRNHPSQQTSKNKKTDLPSGPKVVLEKITRPMWFFIYSLGFLIWFVVYAYAHNAGLRADDQSTSGLTKLFLIILIPISILQFICMARFSLKVFYLLKTLGPRLAAAMAEREAAYLNGKYISFKMLTKSHRNTLLGALLCSIADVLMFPFPVYFSQYNIPNVLAPRWAKWEFLQTVAVAYLTWVYFINICVFYSSIVGAFIYFSLDEYNNWDWDNLMSAIQFSLLALFIYGMIAAFNLLLTKALVEIVSVFLKVEENTAKAE